MTVYIPKSLISESAAQTATRLEKVRNRLSWVQGRLSMNNYAHQKSMQNDRLAELTSALESGADRGTAQRRLEEYRTRVGEWDRDHGKMWESLKAEASALKVEQEQLERYLADYVGLRVGVS